jgi:hypothetical protein
MFRGLEERAHPLDLRCLEHRAHSTGRLPFGFDLVTESGDAHCLHEDLDPRLVNVVPAAIAVVHAQDGIEIRQQIRQWQKLTDDLADHRSAPEPATDEYLEANVALRVAPQMQADVVHFGSGPIFG